MGNKLFISLFLILGVYVSPLIAIDVEEESFMSLTPFKGGMVWRDGRAIPLSITFEIKKSVKGSEQYLALPLSIEFVKALDEPKLYTRAQGVSIEQDGISCDIIALSKGSLLKSGFVGSSEEDYEDGDDTDEDEDEPCSRSDIFNSYEKIASEHKKLFAMLLKRDIEDPVANEKLEEFTKKNLVQINFPKSDGYVKDGKYIWNILVAYKNVVDEKIDDVSQLSWYFVSVSKDDTNAPDYRFDSSLISYKYLYQALLKKGLKINYKFKLSLEKAKNAVCKLIPDISASLNVDEDLSVNFKTPDVKTKFDNVSLRLAYPGQSDLCKKIELSSSNGRITVGKCSQLGGKGHDVILSELGEKIRANKEYTLKIKEASQESKATLALFILQTDKTPDKKDILNVVAEECRPLFENIFISPTPYLVAHKFLEVPGEVKKLVEHVEPTVEKIPEKEPVHKEVVEPPKAVEPVEKKVPSENQLDKKPLNYSKHSESVKPQVVKSPKKVKVVEKIDFKAKFHVHALANSERYYYGILDLSDVKKGQYKLSLEIKDKFPKLNLKFISKVPSDNISSPVLPGNYKVNSENKLEIELNKKDDQHVSIPVLLESNKEDVTKIDLEVKIGNDGSNGEGSAEVLNKDIFKRMQVFGPRFMDKNKVIYSFVNVPEGDYSVEFQSEEGVLRDCGQVNVSHETRVAKTCSDKALKIDLSLLRKQERVDVSVNVEAGASSDLIFKLAGGFENISYKINLSDLFSNIELDESICIAAEKSVISGPSLVSFCQVLQCPKPWIPSHNYKQVSNFYLLDESDNLVKNDHFVLRYKNDPLSNILIPKMMPVKLTILTDLKNVYVGSGMCKNFKCNIITLKDDLKDQISDILNENINSNNEKKSIAIITDNVAKLTEKIRKLPKSDKSNVHLFIPVINIISDLTSKVEFKDKLETEYFDPRRVADLFQNDPTHYDNVTSAGLEDYSLHFGVSKSKTLSESFTLIENLISNVVMPSWINYKSCITGNKVTLNYLDKTLFSITGPYTQGYCDYLTLLST